VTGGPDRVAGQVAVPVGDAELCGDLVLPAGAAGIVLFAHGRGSGRTTRATARSQ
jgi:hypothetical protein